jgi:C-terminal processing protease CtpA/Prc
MAVEADLRQYVLDTKALVSQIDDSHGWFVWAQEREVCGKYMLPVTLQAVEGRWIVTSILNDGLAREAGLRAGDIVDSMNGKSMADRVRELSPYCPASNAASLLSKLSNSIIRSTDSLADLVIDRGGERRTLRAGTFVYPLYNTLDLRPPYFDYQRDSAFCLLDGGIGYINMYRLKREDSIRFKDMIAKASGLIIDNRQNVDALSNSSAVDIIARLILPEHTDIAMFSYPQPTYPGVFSLSRPGSMGFPEASPSYVGKIAILINEHTMSVGEFMSMAFRRALHARLVGVTTAGADGNVTYLSLPDGAVVQFTGLGVYYPDGRETQRIGIQPDIVARQSLAGFLANKDEQLERAIAWVRSKGE